MTNTRTIKNRNLATRLRVWTGIVAAVLMIPLVARFPWTIGDFIFAGVVLFGCASAYEYFTRNIPELSKRLLIAIAILFVLLLIWGWAVA